MFGVRNSISYTQDIKEKEKEEELSKRDSFGKQLLILKSKQVHLICCTKMHVTENQINKI
jgi:hypothetical protein